MKAKADKAVPGRRLLTGDKQGGGNGRVLPPKEHQFKPGQSGNPSGRPIGTGRLLKGILRKLGEEATDGSGRKLGKWIDVLLEALFVGAAKGNISLLQEIINRESGRVPLPIEIPPEGSATYSERIAALFARLDKNLKQGNAGKEEAPADGDGTSDPPGPDTGEA